MISVLEGICVFRPCEFVVVAMLISEDKRDYWEQMWDLVAWQKRSFWLSTDSQDWHCVGLYIVTSLLIQHLLHKSTSRGRLYLHTIRMKVGLSWFSSVFISSCHVATIVMKYGTTENLLYKKHIFGGKREAIALKNKPKKWPRYPKTNKAFWLAMIRMIALKERPVKRKVNKE